MTTRAFYLGVAAIALTLAIAGPSSQLNAQAPALSVGAAEIGGVVTGASGPEAGVWVIAETTDLPTKFAKIVVTDDQGRYMLPELPKAKYQIWVRGYGLVDSPKVDGEPGKLINLTAVKRRQRGGRRRILSGNLLVLDGQDTAKGHVPGHRTQRQRHPAGGQEPAPVARYREDQRLRRLPPDGREVDAHDPVRIRRLQDLLRSLGAPHPVRPGHDQHDQRRSHASTPSCMLENYADWTDRVAKGELPFAKPERPQGVERNIVLTHVGLEPAQRLPAR